MVKHITIIFCLLLLAGCETTTQNCCTDNLYQLQQIQAVHRPHGDRVGISQIRLDALKDTAMSVGARSGLAHRSKQINSILVSEEQKLDQTYNFYGLMLPHDVLPPVLAEADETLNLAAPDTIRLAQKIYKIDVQARFVTAPPTWRDYLWMNFSVPEMPDNTLLPRNSSEKDVWNHYVGVGWRNGMQQADTIFSADLARLKHDYNGMVLYRKLYAQNMVSAPFVAKTDLGITGDPNHMSINDQVLRIVALPQLNLKGESWKPAIVPDELSQQYQQVKILTQKPAPKIIVTNKN